MVDSRVNIEGGGGGDVLESWPVPELGGPVAFRATSHSSRGDEEIWRWVPSAVRRPDHRDLGAFVTVAASGLGTWLSPAPVSDWRKWAPLAVVNALIRGCYLLEVNGPIRAAVKKYVADRNAVKPGSVSAAGRS